MGPLTNDATTPTGAGMIWDAALLVILEYTCCELLQSRDSH